MDLAKKYEITKEYLKLLQEEIEEKENQVSIEEVNKYAELYQNTLNDKEKIEEELEIITETKEEYKNNLYEEKARNKELEKQLKEAEKTNKHIKETVRKPVTINNTDNNLNLFEQIKEGNCIRFPTSASAPKQFKDSFIFEYDNKGAIVYQREVVGMYEKIGKCTKYYQQKYIPNSQFAGIVLNKILGCTEETYQCKVKYGTGSGRKLEGMKYNKILAKEPRFNTSLKKFESNKHYQYIYFEKDGSRYIISNGKKEYI